MKKLFKTLFVAMLAVCAACACAFAVTACDSEEAADYVFYIQYENGDPIDGTTASTSGDAVRTAICKVGEGGVCIELKPGGIYPDKNGKLSLSQSQVNTFFSSDTDITEFYFHVYNVTGCQSDCQFTVSQKGTMECKLTAAS